MLSLLIDTTIYVNSFRLLFTLNIFVNEGNGFVDEYEKDNEQEDEDDASIEDETVQGGAGVNYDEGNFFGFIDESGHVRHL